MLTQKKKEKKKNNAMFDLAFVLFFLTPDAKSTLIFRSYYLELHGKCAVTLCK